MQTLDTSGFLFTEVAGEWSVLTADFGDGYEAGALVGDPQGTRTWSIKVETLPDSTDQVGGIEDELEPEYVLEEVSGFVRTEPGDRVLLETASSRSKYLWRFFRMSKAANDEPFWIEVDDQDDGARKKFLASFADNRLTYAVLCAKLYSTGLQLRQRRVRDVASPVLVV